MKERKNNKGFTLVELIVVMAIMAILVGALAPQVVKYVERARESKDLQVVSTVYTAVQTAIASSESTVADIDGVKLESAASIYSEVQKLLPASADTSDEIIDSCKSNAATPKASKGVYVTYDSTTGYLGVYIATSGVAASGTAVALNNAIKTAVGTNGIGPVNNQ
jgi:type IV pilus assembly protein PilA